jgi:uncharacterized protein YggE
MDKNNISTEVNIVTTIQGLGVVEAKNDLATFSLIIKSKGETLEEAVKSVKEKTASFLKDLESRKIKFDKDITTSLTNYKLENREGLERYAAGFQSINSISWSMFIDDGLDDLFNTCYKIDPTMAQPIFNIKNRAALQEQALQKAGDNLKEKFQKECSMLGISQDKLKAYNWNFGYEGYLPMNKNFANGVYVTQGVTGVTGPQGAQGIYLNNAQAAPQKVGSIYQELLNYKLHPGTTTVSVPVQVNYIWAE